eukprot:COSAG02_NODE_2830_length_7936_cov_40.231849_8_plen_77_part_00
MHIIVHPTGRNSFEFSVPLKLRRTYIVLQENLLAVSEYYEQGADILLQHKGFCGMTETEESTETDDCRRGEFRIED